MVSRSVARREARGVEPTWLSGSPLRRSLALGVCCCSGAAAAAWAGVSGAQAETARWEDVGNVAGADGLAAATTGLAAVGCRIAVVRSRWR